MQWIKLHCQRWFLGSTHFELTAEERAIWIDCLVMAGLNKPCGQIDFFSHEQLAQHFCVSVSALKSALEKFVSFKKVTFKNTHCIKINNWHKHQTPQNLTSPKDRIKSNIKKRDGTITDFNIKKRDKNRSRSRSRIEKNRKEVSNAAEFSIFDFLCNEYQRTFCRDPFPHSVYRDPENLELIKNEFQGLDVYEPSVLVDEMLIITKRNRDKDSNWTPSTISYFLPAWKKLPMPYKPLNTYTKPTPLTEEEIKKRDAAIKELMKIYREKGLKAMVEHTKKVMATPLKSTGRH